jgi:ribonuclease HI
VITGFIDGACEPVNPGGEGACAFVLFPGAVTGGKDESRPAPVAQSAKLIGRVHEGAPMTNNVAEWRAFQGALWWLSKPEHGNTHAVQPIALFMDSQLVVHQFSGKWNCNLRHLQVFRDKCREMAQQFPQLTVTWVPRDQNWVADDMINRLYAANNITVTVRPKKVKKQFFGARGFGPRDLNDDDSD